MHISHKWVRQLVGLPTFIGGAILGERATGGNLLLVIILLIPIVKVYDLVYQFVFSGDDTTGKKIQLVLLFIVQIVVWFTVLYIANLMMA